MDNVILLENRRVAVLQRRADEYLLYLVKETGSDRWALVDRIVKRPEAGGLTVADICDHLDGIEDGRMGLDEQA
jgi:hypothetical protein